MQVCDYFIPYRDSDEGFMYHAYMQLRPALVAMRRSFRRATCSGQPEKEYGTTEQPVEGSIW